MNKKIISITSCFLFPFNLAMSADRDVNLEPNMMCRPSYSEFKRERRGSIVERNDVIVRPELTQEPEKHTISESKPKKSVHFAEPEPKSPVRRDSLEKYKELEFDKRNIGKLSKLSNGEEALLSGIFSNRGVYYIEHLAVNLLSLNEFLIEVRINAIKLNPEKFKHVCKSYLHALMKKNKKDPATYESQINRILFTACDMHKVSINNANKKAKAKVKAKLKAKKIKKIKAKKAKAHRFTY
ncbi:MAG: hypothetical protein V4544_06185 [Pseudomonadota bacterium]